MSATSSSRPWTENSPFHRIFAFRRRRQELFQSGLFDREWYLRTYDDVKTSGEDPVKHFLRIGSAEGRSPGPSFDTRQYLSRNKDVAESGFEPWRHYHLHGRSENRIANSSDELRATLDAIKASLHDLENKMRLVFSGDVPTARLVRLERISAQWQATVPRLLEKMNAGNVSDLEISIQDLRRRVIRLEARVGLPELQDNSAHTP